MLLTEEQVAEIRAGVREGIRGPVMLKWVEQLLAGSETPAAYERRKLLTGFVGRGHAGGALLGPSMSMC